MINKEKFLIRNSGVAAIFLSIFLCCLSACDSGSKRGDQKTTEAENEKVHALLIILGNDSEIQESVEKNSQAITALLRQVSRSCEVHMTVMTSKPGLEGEVSEKVLANTDVTFSNSPRQLGIIKPQQAKDWVRNVKTRPADTLLVYYTGHGTMDKYGTHDLHFDPGTDLLLTRQWLAEELRAKPARLTMLITDTCSENVEAENPLARGGVTLADVRPNAKFYAKNLFLQHSGTLDITAASPGQRAYADNVVGGHFTNALTEALIPESDTNGDNFLSWNEIFVVTRTKTDELNKEASATFSTTLQQQIKMEGQTPLAASLPEPMPGSTQPEEPPLRIEKPVETHVILNFTSVPSGAMVSIDGAVVGQTPLKNYEFEMDTQSTKEIEVTVEAYGYEAFVKKFSVPRGKPFDREFELTPIAEEDMETLFEQAKREERLKVELAESKVTRAKLEEEINRLHKKIEENPTMLNFTSTPSGAEVSIDGFVVGKTPLKNYELKTDGKSTKEIEVTIKAAGYTDTVKKFRVPRGKPFKWEFPLTKKVTEIPKTIIGQDGADMVLITAGEFQMGSNDGEANEQPVRTVDVDAFYMDKYEVTNAQYKKFVDANPQWRKDSIADRFHNGSYLKTWSGNNYPSGEADHPVVSVSWYAAMAYSKWAGKRLPTEAEWEKAARGGLFGKKYPWGNTIDARNTNYNRNVGGTKVVGSYGANGYGLYDMAGNVWEWCLDVYDRDFYLHSPRENPVSGSPRENRVFGVSPRENRVFGGGSIQSILDNYSNNESSRVLRGGSWGNGASNVRCANRNSTAPAVTNSYIGFRCARTVSH